MNDVILNYRPYRWETIGAYIGVVLEIVYVLFLGGVLFNALQCSIRPLIFFLSGAIISAFLIKYCYDRGKVAVCFTQEGLHLINDGKTAWRFVPWESFTYLYYQNDTKRTHLVLSSEELDKKQLKRIILRNHLESKITVNNAVIITLDLLQDKATVQIREIVKEKVSAKIVKDEMNG